VLGPVGRVAMVGDVVPLATWRDGRARILTLAATERTLSQRELNRAVLARQRLLERSGGSLPQVLEQVAGLQAQYAPSMYIGLWSRMKGFSRADLTSALERRTVIQGTLMRTTIHLVSARDYWPFAIAIRASRRRWWRRVTPKPPDGPSDEDMVTAAAELRLRLNDGPLRREEIESILGKSRAGAVGLWLDLVRAPPSGTWERRRANLLAAAEDWIAPPEIAESDAVRHLVRRYLAAFGPASSGDIAKFAGMPLPEVAPAIEQLETRRFRDESGTLLYDLPRGLRPDPDTPAPVRFLPAWDATLLIHVRRAGILPEQYRPLVFSTKKPQSVPTFLVDGSVAGTWKYRHGRVNIEPFHPLEPHVRRQLDDEGERLAALHD
jgi:hypothetical protein